MIKTNKAMKNEQKLLHLLKIARENGWEDEEFLGMEVLNRVQVWKFLSGTDEVRLSDATIGKSNVSISILSFSILSIEFQWAKKGYHLFDKKEVHIPLDYLMRNEPNKISFLEALCRAKPKKQTIIERIDKYGEAHHIPNTAENWRFFWFLHSDGNPVLRKDEPMESNYVEYDDNILIGLLWQLKPDAEKLPFLFDVFSHLIDK